MKYLSPYSVILLALSALPILVVIAGSFTGGDRIAFPPEGWSFRWYQAFFYSDEFVSSAFCSITVASATCLISGVIGSLAGLALSRGQFVGKGIIEILVTAPLAVPAVALGVGFAIFLSIIHMSGAKMGIIVAHSMMTLPFAVRMVRANSAGYSLNLESAAANLGANGWQVFRHVTFPLMLPGILGGMIFAFVTSFDEVVVALFLSGPDAMTLPARIFTYLDQSPGPIVLAAGSLLTFFAVALMGLLERTVKIGRAFGVQDIQEHAR